jgi:hypothetical protein
LVVRQHRQHQLLGPQVRNNSNNRFFFLISIIIVGFGGTSLFGATQPAAQPTSIFGSTTSTFGATQPAQTTNIFGSTLTGTTPMGTTVKFEPVAGQG